MNPSSFPVRFDTLGCRLNQLETETIAAAFRAEGFPVIDSAENESPPSGAGQPAPSLCVINTCAVTAKAEQKARRLIRLLRKTFPDAVVIVTGCYAQTDSGKIQGIDRRVVVVPGREKDRLKNLPAELKRFREKAGGGRLENLSDIIRSLCGSISAPPPVSGGTAVFSFHSRASIKIQDGCSNRCTFCKTRIARGPSVSVPETEIISGIQNIEKAGWGEIVLTGINLHQYSGPQTGADLPGLLSMILDSTDRIFIRISSLYPESITGDFISVIKNERVCPFFHLSIQSGSPGIISRMGRSYGPDEIKNAVRMLREAKENPFISCDIITGFPGETDRDFELTEELCGEIGFAHIHVFPFSPRPGTEAASMKPAVPERVSRERAARLEALSREGKKRYSAYWTGREIPAVWEYSADAKKLKAHTVNSLSLPLVADDGADYPVEVKEALAVNPLKFRGAQIIVRISEPQENSPDFTNATLVKILFR